MSDSDVFLFGATHVICRSVIFIQPETGVIEHFTAKIPVILISSKSMHRRALSPTWNFLPILLVFLMQLQMEENTLQCVFLDS